MNVFEVEIITIMVVGGPKNWFRFTLNNKTHKEDGPAFTDRIGNGDWWYKGTLIIALQPAQSTAFAYQEDFNRRVKLLAFK